MTVAWIFRRREFPALGENVRRYPVGQLATFAATDGMPAAGWPSGHSGPRPAPRRFAAVVWSVVAPPTAAGCDFVLRRLGPFAHDAEASRISWPSRAPRPHSA